MKEITLSRYELDKKINSFLSRKLVQTGLDTKTTFRA